ncbi:hypothetical protein TSUD_42550 [Trifolium subterraneum]|uniref:Uncharacterized protein n=1 Tax=Trifolium subterraneum TaxID=3900 RepID=A0A2Z6MEH6_TRISU|nr:hypothetical protein TSUD_42550 [Trifolium subterraneum]
MNVTLIASPLLWWIDESCALLSSASIEQLVATITPQIRRLLDSARTINYELSESMKIDC